MNYYEFYNTKDRPDLASYVFDLIKDLGQHGDRAVTQGHPQSIISFMYDIDGIMYFYRRLLTGFSGNSRELNIRLKGLFTPEEDVSAIIVLYAVIYALYQRLQEKELYELIPEMIKLNKRIQRVIKKFYPDADKKYFLSPHPDYFANLVNEEYSLLKIA
ncbi:MAG: hypothetical protein LBV72_07025 [Tannerella sp.]|jgi:hypothetical protein|nr:hypothetical protein [Tannerella sp.]